MTVLAEGDLSITLPAGAVGRKFDDKQTHGLSHCMKAVDFIVELEDRLLFVEVKDPEHPNAQQEKRDIFLKEVLSGQLDEGLKSKFRDSFLYEWASGRAAKPIYYLVLIGASTLSAADLLTRTDALKRQIPILGPRGTPWKKPFIAGCAVMNLKAWNASLPQFAVVRVSG